MTDAKDQAISLAQAEMEKRIKIEKLAEEYKKALDNIASDAPTINVAIKIAQNALELDDD